MTAPIYEVTVSETGEQSVRILECAKCAILAAEIEAAQHAVLCLVAEVARLRAALVAAKIDHTRCEDSHYSCSALSL